METRLLQLCSFDANVAQVLCKFLIKTLQTAARTPVFVDVSDPAHSLFSSFKVNKKVTYEVNGAPEDGDRF